jgi:hypothetical protein
LAKAFAKEEIHPGDLKSAVEATSMNSWILSGQLLNLKK